MHITRLSKGELSSNLAERTSKRRPLNLIQVILAEGKNTSKRINYRTFKNILDVINKGETKPTRISFKSNVSYARLVNCLMHLVNIGCIEYKSHIEGASRVYYITKKGECLLHSLQNAENIIDN